LAIAGGEGPLTARHGRRQGRRGARPPGAMCSGGASGSVVLAGRGRAAV